MKDKKKLKLLDERGAATEIGYVVYVIVVLVPIMLWTGMICFGMNKIEKFQTQEVCVGQEIRISANSHIMNGLQFPTQISVLDKTEDYISFVVREPGIYHIGIGRETRYYIRAREGTRDSCITLQNYSHFWISISEFVWISICLLCMFASILLLGWLVGKIYKKQE